MTRSGTRGWAERMKGEPPRYALVAELTSSAAGDIDDVARLAVAKLLERAGGRRIGEVVRIVPDDTRRLALWATKDRDAFITFDGTFVEALTLLDDGRAILTTDTFKTAEAAETVVRRHANAVTSACKRPAAHAVKHDDGDTWLATHEALTPERARRDRLVGRIVQAFTLMGVAVALFLRPTAASWVDAIGWSIDFGMLGGLAGAALSAVVLLPWMIMTGPLRLPPPSKPLPDAGAYRTAGERTHVRIDATPIEEPPMEEGDESDDGELAKPGAETKQRLDPP
ncbi:MAG: hypothetical protein JWM74_4818 [Myxococcaceae bacterium]|nr:hypothetical protein [Myxococcaceae bacterium]